MSAALACTQLRVTLGERMVLRDIELELPAGRWTAIAGPNGAGKTTLLKAMAHLLPCDGQVSVLGKAASAWSARERALAIAWLGQGEPGAEDLLAEDVVMLGRLPHQDWLGVPSARDHAAVLAAMEETQSVAFRGRPLGSLSGGERQRVLLARALAVHAPILLMDEPLSHLDPPHQADWLAIVRRHVARGGTAVSVLHEIGMALQADDLLLVREGQVAHHGAVGGGVGGRAVEAVFDQRLQVHAVAGRWVALPRETEPVL